MSHNPTTLNDCRQLAKEKIPFSFNHVFADLEDGFTTGCSNKPPIYKIYSYSRDNPILVFDFGREKWIGLKDVPNDKISQLHMSLVDTAVISHWASHEELVNISRQGLIGEVTNPKYTADKFVKAKSAAQLLAEYVAINGPIHDHPKPGAHLKKIIVEKNPDWYFKVIGMLQHNYAFINEESPGKVMIYFCHERGSTLGRIPGHIVLNPLDGDGRLPCIVDSFEFSNILKAQSALARNHFSLISELADDSSFDVAPPSGNKFYDVREYESGIYSKQDKWWIKSYFD